MRARNSRWIGSQSKRFLINADGSADVVKTIRSLDSTQAHFLVRPNRMPAELRLSTGQFYVKVKSTTSMMESVY